MAYIETVPDDEATGEVADLYDRERERVGYLPNYARAFSQRPAVYWAWRALNQAIQASSDLRRYELATFAAAKRLRSSYCVLAHGQLLADRFLPPEQVVALPDGLDEADVAVMELAEKIADDATSVSQADVDRLRGLGLTDAEITDVVLAATVRCFFSKTLDALGAEPDAVYARLDPLLRDALTVGRPIEATA
jgi:uncharacterized peroxidase-related enzyme